MVPHIQCDGIAGHGQVHLATESVGQLWHMAVKIRRFLSAAFFAQGSQYRAAIRHPQ
jgi:hypothetical protein